MNEKINLQQLAGHLPADIFGSDNDQRAMLVSELFGLVAEMLESGEQRVILPGFGIFELTGDASNPVVFNPDKAFSQIVNAPFASFSPVILAPNISEDMLDAVAEPLPAASEPDTEVAVGATPAHEELLPEELLPAADGDTDTRNEEQPEESASEVLVEAGEEHVGKSETETTIVVSDEDTPDAGEEGVEESAEAEDASFSEDVKELNEESGLPEVEEEEKSAQNEADVKEMIEERAQEQVLRNAADSANIEENDDASLPPAPSSSRFGIGFFWGVLTGLLVGAIVFLVYVILTSNIAPADSEYLLDDLEEDTAALVED